jgi:hypothetical protein
MGGIASRPRRITRSVVDSVARPRLVDRAVYATITIVCVLIIYDGWANLKVVDAIAVIVGPILAMFISHVFAASVAQHVALGRNRTSQEWLHTVKFESRFLLLAVPPAALLVVLDLAGLTVNDAIRVVVVVEALSIGFWAGLSAFHAGFAPRGVALAVVAGLLVGGIVLLLQVFLQPGKAREGGVADGVGSRPVAARSSLGLGVRVERREAGAALAPPNGNGARFPRPQI